MFCSESYQLGGVRDPKPMQHTRECELILQDGFDPNQLGPDGVSPMHLAAGLGIKAVCLLLQYGGSANIRSADGTTPTHVASIWGEPDCLQILLANGGDPFLEDQDGSNALDLARRYKHPEIIQVVEQYMTLLSQPTEETITPKYTYTRRSTGSSASVRSESPELSDTTLDTSAYDTQRLHEYLREFTKRRRSSVYMRDVQSQVDKYFGDGQRTHLVDVTSPDHPYVESRCGRVQCNSVEGGTGNASQNTHALSPVEESLHLHLSTSEDELSTSCDSYFTCDGEDLDTVRQKSLLDKSFDEDEAENTEHLLNTVIKNTKFMKDRSPDKKLDCNVNQSNHYEHYYDRVSKPVRSRGDKYCRRMPLFIPPETQDLIAVQCDLCGRSVSENYNQVGKDIICDSCERLSQELDDLLIDRSEQVKTAKVPKTKSNMNSNKHTEGSKEYTYEKASLGSKSAKGLKKENGESQVLREETIVGNKNNSHQDIDEMIYKLRQSSLHRNPKINVHNIPFSAKTQDWKNDSLISSDESFMQHNDGLIKSEFHPSDISTITVEEGDSDTVQNEAFIGLSDKSATSIPTFSSRDQSDLNYPLTKARFHDTDLSTITEIDSADITRSNILKDKYSYSSREQDKPQFTKEEISTQDRNNPCGCEVTGTATQDSSPDYVDLWDEVRAKTMKSKTILDTGFIGRESLNSYASDATTVEYVYTDPENGIALVERHIPSLCGSVGSRRSLDSQFSLNSQTSTSRNSGGSQDTQIYDWREEAMCEGFGVQSEINTPKKPNIKPDLKKLDNNTIRSRLCNLGDDPGPVTNTTRQTYLRRLSQLENDPDAKIITKKSPEYPSELRCAIQGNLDFTNMAAEEEKMFAAFQNPKRDHRWREGTLKSSFNYILLDPRITKNLPNRACNMNDLDVFQCFISAIFYVGKGKRARPYSHLYEAIKQMQKPKDKVSSKVTQILDIWSSGLGVVSLHCFQSVIPVEAYTREACIVDAIGLHKLTNMKRGDYYGISVTYSMKQRRKMGVYLLTKALQIFLAEGERQISPLDIKSDCVCQPP